MPSVFPDRFLHFKGIFFYCLICSDSLAENLSCRKSCRGGGGGGGGGRVLPYISYVGMCRPKEYKF